MTRTTRLRAAGWAGLGASLAVLLPRMRREVEVTGTVRRSTATLMWTAYGLAAGLYGEALRHGRPASPARRWWASVVGGSGLTAVAAGMGAFPGAAQVTGTSAEALCTDGIYRYSRNPQYVGLLAAAFAGAAARSSPRAAALAVGYAAVCAWWVPVEETTLERRYGSAYGRYRDRTPRWGGLPSG